MNLDFMLNVYALVWFLDSLFAFCAKFDGNIVAVQFDGFFLQVWFKVAWGFAVRVADCVASHFAFSASFAYS